MNPDQVVSALNAGLASKLNALLEEFELSPYEFKSITLKSTPAGKSGQDALLGDGCYWVYDPIFNRFVEICP
ncbi:hypothetical protein [Dyadobacter sp. 32]|uniref:hypothetical protein n=1 Tax=Dyadobacter sp. 32 TaxID=538966 RepID=UPI0011ED939B